MRLRTENDLKEKIIQVREKPGNEIIYYTLLKELGYESMHYWEYMHNDENTPINIDIEFRYLYSADFEFACALLTAILREDYFSNGALRRRQEMGQVTELLSRMIETIGFQKSKIELINASCADQDVDVVVNAANGGLWAGGGICGVIFKKAGMRELTEACNKHNTPVKDGGAFITPAFNMKNAKAIIHAVGPDFGRTPSAFKELFEAYYNSLVVLKDNGYHSISFPLISAGIFGGNLDNPVAESTKQCCRAYKRFVQDFPDYYVDVKLCAFSAGEMVEAKKEFDTIFLL